MTSPSLHSRSPSLLSSASIPSRPSREYLPLSSHGMPKPPAAGSPRSQRSQRFASIPPPVQIIPSSPPMTPMSSSPMLSPPPLSGMSFDTYVDTEPVTPSFSPRSAFTSWETSMLAPLSPLSRPLTPIESSPVSAIHPSEPTWEMLSPDPSREAQKPRGSRGPSLEKISSITSFSSLPRSPRPEYLDSIRLNVPESATGEAEEKKEDQEQGSKQTTSKEGSSFSVAVPLEKLAMRMKSILKRKKPANSNKKTRKKRPGDEEFDRVPDLHWTEM